MRTLVDGLYESIKYFSAIGGSPDESEIERTPHAGNLTTRHAEHPWTLASSLDPHKRAEHAAAASSLDDPETPAADTDAASAAGEGPTSTEAPVTSTEPSPPRQKKRGGRRKKIQIAETLPPTAAAHEAPPGIENVELVTAPTEMHRQQLEEFNAEKADKLTATSAHLNPETYEERTKRRMAEIASLRAKIDGLSKEVATSGVKLVLILVTNTEKDIATPTQNLAAPLFQTPVRTLKFKEPVVSDSDDEMESKTTAAANALAEKAEGGSTAEAEGGSTGTHELLALGTHDAEEKEKKEEEEGGGGEQTAAMAAAEQTTGDTATAAEQAASTADAAGEDASTTAGKAEYAAAGDKAPDGTAGDEALEEALDEANAYYEYWEPEPQRIHLDVTVDVTGHVDVGGYVDVSGHVDAGAHYEEQSAYQEDAQYDEYGDDTWYQ